ncbi:MAG: efflux RND transporter periplasmic adaptor subunit [Cyanophyceae cyanobacterium]
MNPRAEERLVLHDSSDSFQARLEGGPLSIASGYQIRGHLKLAGLSLVGAVLLLVSLSAVGVKQQASVVEATADEQINALPVQTLSAEPVDSYQVGRTYTGKVSAPRSSQLGFENAGTVIRLYVEEGDTVAAGAVIAKLDASSQETQRQQLLAQKAQALAVLEELRAGPRPEKIASARALVGDLEEQLKLEQLKQTRREFLQAQGAISTEQLDEASFNVNVLKERLLAAQSELDELLAGTRSEQIEAQQAVVGQLEARLARIDIDIAKNTLNAPFAGKIAARQVDEGTVVSSGESIVRLVEAEQPEARIGIPASAAEQIEVGSQQKVIIAEKTYPAQVTAILPEVDPSTRTQTVVLSLPSVSLAPGQLAQWTLVEEQPVEGYWLPTEALVRGAQGLWSCYVLVEEPGSDSVYRLEQQAVEILHQESNRVIVRGTLQPEDRIVASGTHRLVAGQLVYPSQSSQLMPGQSRQLIKTLE